ncbi:MAG TPA: MsnO8 family LLM class oxidoreductase [Steroidobacteraceae bacterium]|nr:MsnO8 family LLM class oxidoreductase [Steroidobacteraceae bacterium]
MIRLSVFDQSPAIADVPHDATIRATVALAIECERLGYRRYWVGEQHNNPGIVGSAPPVLMSAIAARTERIRVGSAGVLLSHYSPYKVAEQFRVLDALAPDRIDLGLARAQGANEAARRALGRSALDADAFAAEAGKLVAWLYDEPTEREPLTAQARAYPRAATAPHPWIHGSSEIGARVAAKLGLPFCFNYSAEGGEQQARQCLQTYVQAYRPTARVPEPYASVLVWALAADSDAQAWHLFASRAHANIMLDTGMRAPLVAPEVALAYRYSERQQARLAQMRRDCIIGAADHVAQRLVAVAAALGVSELVVNTWTHDPAARRRSYELLAAAFGLAGAAP